MQPAGTLGDLAVPPEPAELVLVHSSDPATQDPAQTCPRPRHKIRPPVQGHLRALAGLPKATCTHTTDVLRAGALGVGLERCLRRRGSSPRAEPLLVLRI